MQKKNALLFLLLLLIITGLLMYGPIPQDPGYHQFADGRTWFDIRHFMNVITNLPFALIGGAGWRVSRNFTDKKGRTICCTLFISFLLLTAGSSYYHLQPQNSTLVFDRLAMSLIFMSFFAFIIYERIDPQKGYLAFFLLNIAGVLAVLYWILTERAGKGDLRWYGIIQFFPIIAIPLILFLYPSSFKHEKNILPLFLFFGGAKLTEAFDQELNQLLHNTLSGHSIKHLLMAAAGYCIVVLVKRRAKAHRENGKTKAIGFDD